MKTVKLKFKETVELPEYLNPGIEVYCKDGELVNVKEDNANQLLKDFPKNFELVKELTKSEMEDLEKAKKKKEKEGAEEKAKKKKDEEDKIAKVEKDKGR